MEIDIDEDDMLRTLANGGSMDFSVWPALLQRIVARVEKIAHEEFPIPNLPLPPSSSSTLPRPGTQTESETGENFLSHMPSSPGEPPSSTTSSQDTNKENTPVVPRAAAPAPQPTSALTATPLPPGTLPPQIGAMLTEITAMLKSFPKYPPHTIQRLSELILTPRRHYRNLPSYLHALDRVVHVTSGLNVYPLPPAVPDMSSASVLSNGISDVLALSVSASAAPGSDEALGGALLTPIPWLQPNRQHTASSSPQPQQTQPGTLTPGGDSSSPVDGSGGGQQGGGPGGGGGGDLEPEVRTESTETIEGPNGIGSIETVSISVNGVPSMGARGVGVTQGELLRQEQRAGVVPVSQLVPGHHHHPHHPLNHHHQQQQQQQQARHAQQQQQQQNRGSPAGNGGGSDSPSASSASSATMVGEEGRTTPGSDGQEPVAPVNSTSPEEEMPHARGPEEIGAEDTGPQPHGSGAYAGGGGAGGPGGVDMRGIDVEAAVGRKAAAATSAPKVKESVEEEEGSPPGADDGSKMDFETEDGGGRAVPQSPKRGPEGELEGEGEGKKKLKEDTDGGDAGPKREGEGAAGGAGAGTAAAGGGN